MAKNQLGSSVARHRRAIEFRPRNLWSSRCGAGERHRGRNSVSDAERWLSRFINRFGSPNWVSTTHVCNWHKDTGFTYTFGVELPTPDLVHSNAFLLWGHNPSSTSLILAHDIVAARKRGMKIVAVDPRRIGIPGQADVLLQVRPGTDGALALALIDVVITDKLYDEAFVRQWTNGSFLFERIAGQL